MGIGKEDLNLLLKYRKIYSFGNKCLIYGNVSFWFNNELNNKEQKEEFKKIMNFDVVDTIDLYGDPDYKLDLQEKLPDEFYNKYDWVLDVEVLYCVFDYISAWKNMFYTAKDDCVMVHFDSLCGHYGRSCISMTPSLFGELYDINNFNFDLYYSIKSGLNKDKWINIKKKCYYLKSASQDNLNFVDYNCSIRTGLPCDSSVCCVAYSNNQNTHILKKYVPEHFIKSNGV